MWVYNEVNDKRSLSLSNDREEIHIFIGANYQGNVYVSIPTKMMKEFLEVYFSRNKGKPRGKYNKPKGENR